MKVFTQTKQQSSLLATIMRNYSIKNSVYARTYFALQPSVLYRVQARNFGLPKYKFEDEKYEPNRFQLSIPTHQSNAEELINAFPIVEVQGETARCSGVNELGLGHPVQYIQLNKRTPHSPTTCKWCGLRFRKSDSHDHH
ncbi:UNKNOWN [Stylonychia lemnae]|uniref:Zinc finger CHCC-type domain-containing protein n=1 Tax=Stylonychia lemnae TaxID=5949 RepID=A0A077ZZC9_STYLE|nr:UNKNOWN [Stylonychia lemnae]|eukprot:CDW74578.1 UNKNOWN [Stylonychia lemnae]